MYVSDPSFPYFSSSEFAFLASLVMCFVLCLEFVGAYVFPVILCLFSGGPSLFVLYALGLFLHLDDLHEIKMLR